MNMPQIATGTARALTQLVRQSLLDAAAAQAAGEHSAPFTVPAARVPRAPALLAGALPGSAAAREERRALYVRCLSHYRRAVGAPSGPRQGEDLGAAAAHFVNANLRALQGVEATPVQFQALQRQLAILLRSQLTEQSERDRQVQFEKLALLAVLMTETWTLALRQGPAALAHVRQAARGYLQELLGLDPDALVLGDGGLALRDIDVCEAREPCAA
jgi:hypothetical protein